MFLPHPRVKVSIVGSLRDREVACSASDRQVWRTVSSQSSHHPKEVLLAQFSLYVHKGGLKPDSFYFLFQMFFKILLMKIYRKRVVQLDQWLHLSIDEKLYYITLRHIIGESLLVIPLNRRFLHILYCLLNVLSNENENCIITKLSQS